MSNSIDALKTWAEIKNVGEQVASFYILLRTNAKDVPEEFAPMLDAIGDQVKKIVADFTKHEQALYALIDEIEKIEKSEKMEEK